MVSKKQPTRRKAAGARARRKPSRATRGSGPQPEARPEASLATAYRQAALRAVLAAARSLCQALGRGVPRRRLVNFLRGNQLPPRRENGPAPPLDCYGLLEGWKAGAIGVVVDSLLDEGYLLPAQEHETRLELSSDGKAVLAHASRIPESLFPRGPRLGENEAVETRLRALRRTLAAREGRAPFSVFPNATLARLASELPASLPELALVPGLGEARIRRYGPQILAALRRGT